MAAVGCSRQKQLDELKKEIPFRSTDDPSAAARVLIGCEFIPIELPGHVDLASLENWPGNINAETVVQSPMVFQPEQLHLWKQNGFEIFIAPISSWPALRQSLIQTGGNALTQMTSIFRNRTEHADFGTMWLEKSQSLFITDLSGQLSGHTLGRGRCGFRIACEPALGVSQQTLLIHLTPIFVNAQVQDRFERDDFGVMRRVTERPELAFDQLTLAGLIPNGYFIGLAVAAPLDDTQLLGKFFMTGDKEGVNSQLVCLFVPQIQLATVSTPDK